MRGLSSGGEGTEDSERYTKKQTKKQNPHQHKHRNNKGNRHQLIPDVSK